MEERRRLPRSSVQGQSLEFSIAESARVLDLSSAGVLLQTSSPPDLGSHALLQLSVHGEPLTTEIEVRRVTPTEGGYRVGARFIDITATHRRLIDRFMSQ